MTDCNADPPYPPAATQNHACTFVACKVKEQTIGISSVWVLSALRLPMHLTFGNLWELLHTAVSACHWTAARAAEVTDVLRRSTEIFVLCYPPT